VLSVRNHTSNNKKKKKKPQKRRRLILSSSPADCFCLLLHPVFSVFILEYWWGDYGPTEAEFLDVIGIKILKEISSLLFTVTCTKDFTPPPPPGAKVV
jgi:hypothetical protein